MALSDREEVFDVEVPAGTAKATPIEHSITFPPGTVVELQILFPAGCAGLVGIALAQAHQPVFPRGKGAFVRGDNETVTREVTGYNNTGDWQLFGYNTDSNLHTVQVRFAVVENIKVTPTEGPPGTVAVGPS